MRFPNGGISAPEPDPTPEGVVVPEAVLKAAQDAVYELTTRAKNPIAFDSLTGETSQETQLEVRTTIAQAIRAHNDREAERAKGGGTKAFIVPDSQMPAFIDQILREMRGYGPIDPYLRDPSGYEELMINGPEQVLVVHRGGRTEKVPVRFRDDRHVQFVAQRLLATVRRRITEAEPLVDAALPGMRINVALYPIAVDGTSVTIRFHHPGLTALDLVGSGMVTPEALAFLEALIRGGCNVLIVGPTHSGKTTFLNVLSHYIPTDERIVTIEDAVELDLRAGNVVRLETRPPNVEGKGEITIRDLVKNALRMRPDRIVVGEVRDREALDLLVAGNSGHAIAATIHANSATDGLRKVATLAAMADEHLSDTALAPQVATAFQAVIYLESWEGQRQVVQISEVSDVDPDTYQVVTRDVFLWQADGLAPTGYRPERLLKRLRRRRIPIPPLWEGR